MEGTGGGSSPEIEESWSASTNWDVAEGSAIRDPISFDTSAADDDDPPSSSSRRSLVLHRPLSDGSLPCEVTVYFKEKHEVHQIYVCSTARVYEIYYTLNQLNNSKEYLCTVRCGVATEVAPSSFIKEAVPESHNGFETVDMPRTDVSGNQDGWIEVQVPDTALQNDKVNTLSRYADVFFEATAQISDASPCVSITLRFLSLQTRSRVQVNEIYIYADPVASSIPDESAGREERFGGNSLLAMFVPTLLQLSKSGKSGAQAKAYSDPSGISETCSTTGSASAHKEYPLGQEAHFSIKDNILPFQQKKVEVKPLHSITDQNVKDQEGEPSMAYQSTEILHNKPETVQLESCNIVSDQEHYSTVGGHTLKPSDGTNFYSENLLSTPSLSGPAQVSVCDHEDKSQSNGGIEKKLDELVSRIGRLEAFFSRFEENLVKPLNSIDSRLQRLEQQVDAYAEGHQFCGKGSYSKFSAPEFSCDNIDSSTDEKYNTSFEEIGFIIPPLPVNDVSSETMPNICPGFIAKAPDVPENCDYNIKIDSASASDLDDSNKAPDISENCEDNAKINNASASDPDDSSKSKNHSSIDHALASALAAFLTSKPIEDAINQNETSDSKERGTSSSDRTIPRETDGFIKNSIVESELEPETAVQDSLLSVLTYLDTPDSDPENDKFNISDKFANSTAFDDSSSDELDLSLSPSKALSGLKILAPEFPSDDDVSVDSDDSDRTFKGHHENEEYMPNESILISALDLSSEFRGSRSTITSTVAGAEAIHQDNSAISYLVGATSLGPDETYSHNDGDKMNNEMDCDYILRSLQLEEGLYYKPRKYGCSVEAPHEDAIIMPCQFKLKEMGNTVKLHHCFSPVANETDDENFVPEMAQPLGVKSDGNSIVKSCNEGILCDTCPGNTANGHKSFSQIDVRREESRSSPQGSVYKSHKDHMDLAADSIQRTFLTGSLGLDSRVVNENTCPQASDGTRQDGDQKHLFSNIPSDYNDFLVNAKFVSDQTLRSDLPLDILLGEAYVSEEHICDSKDLDNYVGESYSNDHFDSERNSRSRIVLDTLLGETDVPEGQNSGVNHTDDDTGELHLLKPQWRDPNSSIISQLVHETDHLSLGDKVSGLYSDVAVQRPQSRDVPFISLI